MGRPVAYEYKGFIFKGKMYPVWHDDTDPNQYYVMPPAMTVAEDDAGPKINAAICETIARPSVKGLGMLVPYIPNDLLAALKKEYGPRIAPLPVSSAGQVMVTGVDWWVSGLAVKKPWISDELSYVGLPPEQEAKLKELKKLYDDRNIRAPLTALLPDGQGYAIEMPDAVGSNIGAEVPISFAVLGADNVKEFSALMKGGGIINGQLVYYYIGTTRPWKLQIKADLSKVHSYISQHLSVGYYWATADIYDAVEKMQQQNIIEITVWDEDDKVTAKYKPEQIFDTILKKILDKAFNFYPNIKPEKNQAQASGKRHWWWHGSYQRKSSTVDVSEIINIKITIHGKSEPIPVSMGFYLAIPPDRIQECTAWNLAEDERDNFLRYIYNLDDEQVMKLSKELTPMLKEMGDNE